MCLEFDRIRGNEASDARSVAAVGLGELLEALGALAAWVWLEGGALELGELGLSKQRHPIYLQVYIYTYMNT